jgi:hypothetical protein
VAPVTGCGGYALAITDVETGQAVHIGTIREADVATVFVVRVKVAERRISEIETLVIRNQMAAESLDMIGAPRPVWSQPLPAVERASRAELVRVSNMYFSGIERNDGRGEYPIADTCARLENGVVTAGDPAEVAPADRLRRNGNASAAARSSRRACSTTSPASAIGDSWPWIPSAARVAFAFFDNGSGDARSGTLRDGTKVVSGPAIPWTWQIAEVFRIEKGLIVAVESVLHSVPYGMGSGWSSWEESMSSLPRLR